MSSAEEKEQPRTVFRAPDQQEMIARIESIEDDETRSTFFDERLTSETGAAHRTFEAGLAAFTGGDHESAQPASSPSGAPSPPFEPRDVAPALPFSENWQADTSARASFILRGPAGVDRSLGQP